MWFDNAGVSLLASFQWLSERKQKGIGDGGPHFAYNFESSSLLKEFERKLTSSTFFVLMLRPFSPELVMFPDIEI